MKYSLDCYIKTNNQGIRNAVKQLIPSIGDNRIWNGEYIYEEFEDAGTMVFSCMVRFNLKANRDGIASSVKGLASVINSCEDGSFVRKLKCYHDETPARRCELETILRKN